MKLGIYGAGGMGRVLLRLAKAQNAAEHRWDEFLFIDDVTGEAAVAGCRVLPFEAAAAAFAPEALEVVISLGEPAYRKLLYQRVKEQGFALARLAEKDDLEANRLGEGVVLGKSVSAPCDVTFGDNVMVLAGASIGHDTVLGAHSVLCANATLGGCTTVGAGVFIGMGATVNDHITLGDGAIVSMGAVVFKSLPAGAKVLGNPARALPAGKSPKIFR